MDYHTTTTSRSGRRNFFGRRKRVQHTKRHATIGDKISGAFMRLRGSLTRNPGVKVCYNIGLCFLHGWLTKVSPRLPALAACTAPTAAAATAADTFSK